MRCALTGENANGRLPASAPYAGADVAHFGNIRGTNEFEDHEVMIILGREQPSGRDAEKRAPAPTLASLSRGRAHAREAAGNQRPWPADRVPSLITASLSGAATMLSGAATISS